jgi:hypothetical protein
VTTLPAEARQQSKDHSGETQSTIYCVVPPELSELWEPLCGHFAGDPTIQVVIEQRRSERRSGNDRRYGADGAPSGVDRRLARGLEGRRFGERRAIPIPVEERPALSPELYCYADKLSFVRRLEGSTLHWDLTRLRLLAGEWRDRCRDAEREATGLLRTLVRVTDDLGKVRSWSPRKFMAVYRAQQTIEHYRMDHLSGGHAPSSNRAQAAGSTAAQSPTPSPERD